MNQFDKLKSVENEIEVLARNFMSHYYSGIDSITKSDNIDFYPYCMKTRETHINVYPQEIMDYSTMKATQYVDIHHSEVGDPWEEIEPESFTVNKIPLELFLKGTPEEIFEYGKLAHAEDIKRRQYMEVRDKYSPIMYMDHNIVQKIVEACKKYERISYEETKLILEEAGLIDSDGNVL